MTSPGPGDLHDDQIVELLRSGAHEALLSAYFGEAEYRELCFLAKLAATRRNPRGAPVLILPGVMGSRLGRSKGGASHLIWLHPTSIGAGGLLDLALPGARGIQAVGVMLPGYLKLKLSLEIAGFKAMFYPFDWRRDIEGVARTLIRALDRLGGTRVRIVAHSMGGLVARAALRFDVERRIHTIVQLGSPNEGSYAPVQALRAAYPTVRKIAALDHERSAEELARRVFLTLPGLYQMLPTTLPGANVDLFKAQEWPEDLQPEQRHLSRARRARERLPDADRRCYAIVGVQQETVTSLARTPDGFLYEITRNGDGTVPSERAQWRDARTWYVAEEHGALPRNNVVLAAVADILAHGDTTRLTARHPATSAEVIRRVSDVELRARVTEKVRWETLSLECRRRILEPVITPGFAASGR